MTKIDDLIKELDDVIYKLKLKIIYYQSENKDLKIRLKELKEYVKGK
tara:strand:- start:239 stop:379 length:141 start_codon:yes stop_codon:yes gene_type:complete